jgi:hypothetical protein
MRKELWMSSPDHHGIHRDKKNSFWGQTRWQVTELIDAITANIEFANRTNPIPKAKLDPICFISFRSESVMSAARSHVEGGSNPKLPGREDIPVHA